MRPWILQVRPACLHGVRVMRGAREVRGAHVRHLLLLRRLPEEVVVGVARLLRNVLLGVAALPRMQPALMMRHRARAAGAGVPGLCGGVGRGLPALSSGVVRRRGVGGVLRCVDGRPIRRPQGRRIVGGTSAPGMLVGLVMMGMLLLLL
jgi:hypothetical protein